MNCVCLFNIKGPTIHVSDWLILLCHSQNIIKRLKEGSLQNGPLKMTGWQDDLKIVREYDQEIP